MLNGVVNQLITGGHHLVMDFVNEFFGFRGLFWGSTGTHSARHAYSANNLDDFGVPHFNTPPDGLTMV